MTKSAIKRTTTTRKLSHIESLEHRNLLSVSPSYEEFILSTDSRDSAYIQLSNESEFKAEFTMRFNGNISVNLQDLVQQIRNEAIPGDDGSMPDYERAYYYLMKNHAHDFPLSGKTWMHEPSLYMNSLGAGLCDDAATALSLIWNAMGYESRVWLLSGHVVSEVHTGERWQLYDADLKVHYYNRDGQVAGLEELAAQPELITNPTNPASPDSYVYRGRISQIYSSVDNNSLCTACDANTVSRDLVFEIPAGGTLEWGQETVDKTLPLIHLDSATKLGLIKVTIPADSTGTLDIPLALYDVRGSGIDEVTIAGETLALATDAAFEYFNENTRVGNRIQTISYADNAEPIEVLYFFNQRFATVQNHNSIEIEHRTDDAANLSATLEGPIATNWQFGSGNAGTPDGVTFDGAEYIDATGNQSTSLFNGEKAFEIEARIQLDSTTGPRRPVIDAYRFSVEIDEQNRPYVYYRAENDKWVGLRGDALSASEWHTLKVTYDSGRITLSVDGTLKGSKTGGAIDAAYPTSKLLIGKSEHLGGLYFEGKIDDVAISEVTEEQLTSEVQVLLVLEADSDDDEQYVRGGAVYGPVAADIPVAATPATTMLQNFSSTRRRRWY